MKKIIILLGTIGLLIGCALAIFSVLWELSEIRGACQDCPINFWKNTNFLDIVNIVLTGVVGLFIGGLLGLIIYKLMKK